MKNVRFIIMVLLLVIISAVGGAAQTTPDYDSVEELLLLLRIDETLARTFERCDQLPPVFPTDGGGELTPEQLRLPRNIWQLFDLMLEELSWEGKDDYIRSTVQSIRKKRFKN